jgi:hypothetical protein
MKQAVLMDLGVYREKPPENYVFPNEMLLVSYNIII